MRQKNNLTTWRDLLSFSFKNLSLPHNIKDKEKLSAATQVKRNLTKLDVVALDRKPKPLSVQDRLVRVVEAKLSDGNISGAMSLLSSDDSLAPKDEETLYQLKCKHPSAPLDYDYTPSSVPSTPPSTTPEEVSKAIASFRN